MFHIIEEGKNLKNGFNFYPWSDKYSFGFRFLLINKFINILISVRRSTHLSRWIFNITDANERNKWCGDWECKHCISTGTLSK